MIGHRWGSALIIVLGLSLCPWSRAVDTGKDDSLQVSHQQGENVRTQGSRHALRVQYLLQPQFEHFERGGGESESSFNIKRAQLRFSGHILDPRLKYKTMVMGTTASGDFDVDLRDLWVSWRLTDAFQFQAGQFLVHFDYENLAPTWALQLVNRSIINSRLGFERDIGVQAHGNLLSNRLQYYLYAMNGDGRNELNNWNDLIYGTRVDLHILGKHQYVLPDLKPSDEPHLALGFAFLHDMGNARVDTNRLNRVTTDLIFRYMGFSALGLVNWARNEDRDATDFGYLVQGGYFVVPDRLEVAGRWAEIGRGDALGDDLADPREATIGLNYYFKAHKVKLQADYSRLWNNKSKIGQDDDRLRLQLQLFF